MLTVEDLPARTLPGVSMTCEECGPEHGTFSALRGDYFWMPRGKAFVCPVCGAPACLIRQTTHTEMMSLRRES